MQFTWIYSDSIYSVIKFDLKPKNSVLYW